MSSGITATVKNKTDGVVTTASVRITQPEESGNVCPQHAKSYICGLGRGDEESPLCEHHDVFIQRTNTSTYVTKVKEYKHIIEKPTYTSLDQAAMAAANIILYYLNKDGDVDKNSIESTGYIDKNYIAKDDDKKNLTEYGNLEYGIAIYGNDDDNEFCLVKTRIGDEGEVKSQNDYDIKHSKYTFKADVHSHPKYGIHEF